MQAVYPNRISERVPELLVEARSWQVELRFRHGLLLSSGSDDLFIGSTRASAGPFNIAICDSYLDLLQRSGEKVESLGAGILALSGMTLVCHGARQYKTRAGSSGGTRQTRLLERLQRYLADCVEMSGFGVHPLVLAGGVKPAICAATELNSGAFGRFVNQLVGRGLGLTPSGDDFLVGMLAVSSTPKLKATILEQALKPGVTTQVSQAYYRSAAKGHFTEDVARLLSEDYDDSAQSHHLLFEKIRTYGHSSGIDLLAGMYYGLKHNSVSLAQVSRANSAAHA